MAIRVKNLRVVYEGTEVPAVEGVSFEVEKGKMAVLIGPNGSGKSTVIKAILGLLEHEGEVSLLGNGEKINKLEVGYVAQRFGFDRSIPMTVREFVKLALVTCVHKNCEKEKMMKQVLEQVGMKGTEKQMLGDLSGGQFQRVLLARALIHRPKLLVLDEPEAGVDVEGEEVFYELLESLVRKKKITVLMASHELEVVGSYADQVLCVNKRLICQGKPKEVLKPSVFKELYGAKTTFYRHHHVVGGGE